jgi:hypothetical protein
MVDEQEIYFYMMKVKQAISSNNNSFEPGSVYWLEDIDRSGLLARDGSAEHLTPTTSFPCSRF